MISLIVCTYNRDAYIYNTLECIAENDFPADEYEIVVVNNNCTDNTQSECNRFRAKFPNVNYINVVEEAQGLSFARNRGIRESHGDCIVFIDDDAYIEPDYLRNLNLVLSEYPQMMAFGGKIIPLYETGYEPEWMSPRLVPIVSAIDLGRAIIPFKGNSYPIGANMGFRKSCLESVGEFNTTLGRSKKNMIGGEEKDMFERVRQLNMVILYIPQLVAQHVIPATRTTLDNLKRMAYGVGASEKIRCNGAVGKYICSLGKELWKWAGSFVLWAQYLILGKGKKAQAIMLFRWNVSKGLLTYKIQDK